MQKTAFETMLDAKVCTDGHFLLETTDVITIANTTRVSLNANLMLT